MHDVIQAFHSALAERGICPRDLKADGQIHRCGTERKPRSTNGVYCLHLDARPAGWFQNHEDGLGVTRWTSDQVSELTSAEKLAWRREMERRKIERTRTREHQTAQAARRAVFIWDNARHIRSDHPYLTRKRIGIRGLKEHRGLVVVPMCNAANALVNLQFIAPDGGKRFLTGGQKKGCWCSIGSRSVAPRLVLIGEGFATMASVLEATDAFCVVAFDSGNIEPVARIWRQKMPHARILICADNDPAGRKAAENTVRAVSNCVAAWPEIEGEDFNDVHDKDQIRSILRTALTNLQERRCDVG